MKSFIKSFLFIIIDILVLLHWGFLEIAKFLRDSINRWIDVTKYIKAIRDFFSKYFNHFLNYLESPKTPTIIAFIAFFSVFGLYEYIQVYIIGDMLLDNIQFGYFSIVFTLSFTLLKALLYVFFSKIMLFLLLFDLWKATQSKLMAIKLFFIGNIIKFMTYKFYPFWIATPISRAKEFYSNIRNGNFEEISRVKLIIVLFFVLAFLVFLISRVSFVVAF